jgi:hypothetical protein
MPFDRLRKLPPCDGDRPHPACPLESFGGIEI